jgi:hypothetical protein
MMLIEGIQSQELQSSDLPGARPCPFTESAELEFPKLQAAEIEKDPIFPGSGDVDDRMLNGSE